MYIFSMKMMDIILYVDDRKAKQYKEFTERYPIRKAGCSIRCYGANICTCFATGCLYTRPFMVISGQFEAVCSYVIIIVVWYLGLTMAAKPYCTRFLSDPCIR